MDVLLKKLLSNYVWCLNVIGYLSLKLMASLCRKTRLMDAEDATYS